MVDRLPHPSWQDSCPTSEQGHPPWGRWECDGDRGRPGWGPVRAGWRDTLNAASWLVGSLRPGEDSYAACWWELSRRLDAQANTSDPHLIMWEAQALMCYLRSRQDTRACLDRLIDSFGWRPY